MGVLSTPHGKVLTPSYVIVATEGEIKCLKPSDIKRTKTQIIIANTYHLWDKIPKEFSISKSQFPKNLKKSFIIKKIGVNMPTMTDSGGFQVFSLGFKKKVGKILNNANLRMYANAANKEIRRQNIKITSKGVYFYADGKKKFLGPEISIKLQEKINADIIFAFDECTSPLDNFKYNQKALERTHRWAKECLAIKNKKSQLLFGIVQGGVYKSLRQKSAKFIGSLPFDGFGIGGSFGEDEMVKTLKWMMPHLPEGKPKHLLGIGKIRDIFNAVENGIDLFDCVIPTREARHGRLWTAHGPIDIKKSKYAKDDNALAKNCLCPVCSKNLTRSHLHKLFKNPAKINEGKRYATLHNVWFFNDLLEKIRDSIAKNKFSQFKKGFLSKSKSA